MNRKLSETHLSRGESFWNVQEESYWKRIRKYVNKRKKINYRNERNSYEEDEKMICFGLALAAVSLTACGGKKEAETIRIGVVCPRTGESSLFGDVLAETIELLAKQKNESGGILGKQIEIKVYDNRDDAVETTNAARKAVLNDKVCAFIGTDSSATSIALGEVAAENEIPFITSIATNSKVTMTEDGQVRPWAFRACLSDPQSGAILGQYAVNECNYKKIAIIYDLGSDFL